MEIPLPLVVVGASLGGTGVLGFVAWCAKTLLEHARILAVVQYRIEQWDVVHAIRAAEPNRDSHGPTAV